MLGYRHPGEYPQGDRVAAGVGRHYGSGPGPSQGPIYQSQPPPPPPGGGGGYPPPPGGAGGYRGVDQHFLYPQNHPEDDIPKYDIPEEEYLPYMSADERLDYDRWKHQVAKDKEHNDKANNARATLATIKHAEAEQERKHAEAEQERKHELERAASQAKEAEQERKLELERAASQAKEAEQERQHELALVTTLVKSNAKDAELDDIRTENTGRRGRQRGRELAAVVTTALSKGTNNSSRKRRSVGEDDDVAVARSRNKKRKNRSPSPQAQRSRTNRFISPMKQSYAPITSPAPVRGGQYFDTNSASKKSPARGRLLKTMKSSSRRPNLGAKHHRLENPSPVISLSIPRSSETVPFCLPQLSDSGSSDEEEQNLDMDSGQWDFNDSPGDSSGPVETLGEAIKKSNVDPFRAPPNSKLQVDDERLKPLSTPSSTHRNNSTVPKPLSVKKRFLERAKCEYPDASSVSTTTSDQDDEAKEAMISLDSFFQFFDNVRDDNYSYDYW